MSSKAPKKYAAAVSRLKTLVAQLESGEVDVDEMEAVVRESVELINACRSRLRATQTSVDTLLASLQDEAEASVPAASAPPIMVADDLDPFADD